MIETIYWAVKPKTVLTRFPNAAPCSCNNSVKEEAAIYKVMVIKAEAARLHLGHLVKEIHIKCSCCGKESVTDVENLEIYEAQLQFNK